MSIRPVSFGTELKYKKSYEVQKKDGTPVSKEYADKVVKRNMIGFTTLGFPLSLGVLNSIFFPNKKTVKYTWAISAALAVSGALVSNMIYKKSKNAKDFNPQPFYKWGGFNVVEKNK
ncbi:MAG TPA: hypothetical protein IAD26_02065 [Candidatus Limenecus avicola]|uniref:Uncharacterized protein n=1 Tax=Candidatus Limenecus avicola TaxID=2840847 RepID=A0A9D1SRC4_9CLOT|nr:hypothetical protein [Candidatus Limenecus avicola]